MERIGAARHVVWSQANTVRINDWRESRVSFILRTVSSGDKERAKNVFGSYNEEDREAQIMG
jgi:hypothetical protein